MSKIKRSVRLFFLRPHSHLFIWRQWSVQKENFLWSRQREEVARPAASRRLDSPHLLCSHEAAHPLFKRSPHTQNPPISFFIFSKFLRLCSNIDIKRLRASELGLGLKAPSRRAPGSSAFSPEKKTLQGPFTMPIQQRGDTVADGLFKCPFKRGERVWENSAWRFWLHVELFWLAV